MESRFRSTALLIGILILSAYASSSPDSLIVDARVNGNDVIGRTLEVHPSEVLNISLAVTNTANTTIEVYGIQIETEPAFFGMVVTTLIKDLMNESFTIPPGLEIKKEKSIKLPGILPAGDYSTRVRLLYRIDGKEESGDYSLTIKVPSHGIISNILGFLAHALPKEISVTIFKEILKELKEMPVVE